METKTPFLRALTSAVALTLIVFIMAAPANAANIVQITKLTNVSLLLRNPLVNATSSESVCVYSGTVTKGYGITATGSGTGSAFTLSGGVAVPVLPYTVQWSQTSGQASGTTLSPGVQLTGLVSTAIQTTCTFGPSTTASLIVLITAANLQTASAGITYTGVLTLVVAPE